MNQKTTAIMKKLILLLLILPAVGYSQSDSTKPLEFSLVDSVAGSKKQLAIYSKAWIAKTFNSGKTVIEMEDMESGKIIGRAIMDLKDHITTARFLITIDTKDNKYRCVLSDYERYVQTERDLQPKPAADGGSFQIDPDKKGFMQGTKNKYTLQVRQASIVQSEMLLADLKNYMLAIGKKSDF